MKTLMAGLFGATLLLMSGCAEKVDLEAEKANVKVIVDQWNHLFESEDMELFAQIMAHDADMVTFGTDVAERWVGWEALKESVEQQFASFEDSKLTVKDQVIKVNPSGNTAWFSEVIDWDLVAEGQPVHVEGARFTGVLEKRNGTWVFVQFHASAPVSGQVAQY